MKIIDIPSSTIDLITKLNCHEVAIGETISQLTATELKEELEQHLLWIYDEGLVDCESVITGDIDMGDFSTAIVTLIDILSELEEDSIDRLSVTMSYRIEYDALVEMVFSEKTFAELEEEEVEHLRFIPTTYGWILPVCFRCIYDDNLTVYNRYTDEEKKFGDVGYTEHDGILFDYYFKTR